MNLKYIPIFLFVIISGSVNAQNLLKGTVFEDGTSNKMANVFIRDNNSKQLTITDKKGNFSVYTETGHVLIFEAPGYVSDTLYVADLAPKQIRMVTQTIALRQVSINATRAAAFDAHKEYPEVYTKSKLYVLSPTSWFGKEAVDARRLKSYFKVEAEERHIDQVFSTVYVGSLVPLKGKDLEDFMTIYRPSYDFVNSNTGPSMAVYVNDSYKKFQALPPSKRKLQKLTAP